METAAGRAIAYLITFSCYGTRVHGDDDGSVDRNNNLPRTPHLPSSAGRAEFIRGQMAQPPYEMNLKRATCVLSAIQEVCQFRTWQLFAAHVRSTHVHAVVHAPSAPEPVMNAFKSYASRALNSLGIDEPGRKRWARHGSTRYLFKMQDVELAIHYVVHEQGEPTALFVDRDCPGLAAKVLTRNPSREC